MFFIPELSTLSSASENENFIKVHIWIPSLNPAVDPAEESFFTEPLSDFIALESDVEEEDWEPLHPAMIIITSMGIKKATNRFMCIFLFEEYRFRHGKFLNLC